MKVNFLKLINIPGIENYVDWKSYANPFRNFSINNLSNNEPEWYICSVSLANSPIGSVIFPKIGGAAGSSIYLEESLTSCIGEAFERYCASNFFLLENPYMRKVDYSKNYTRCINEENAPQSFKQNGITCEIEHSKVKYLIDDQDDFLPYELVHIGYLKKEVSKLFASPISTGCAFYTDKVNAIKRGLFEVIERDALMNWWYLSKERTKEIITNEITSFDIHERLLRIQSKGLEIKLFEISYIEGFPVVFCMIKSNHFPYFSCGASCNNDIEHAIIKSIDEAVSIRSMSIWMGPREVDTNNFNWIQNLEDHMSLYANWKNSSVINQIFELKTEKINLDKYSKIKISNMEDMRNIAYKFKDKGYDIYYKDLTMPELIKLGVVCKVIIPQMTPLSQAYHSRWLSNITKKTPLKEINHNPQPFS